VLRSPFTIHYKRLAIDQAKRVRSARNQHPADRPTGSAKDVMLRADARARIGMYPVSRAVRRRTEAGYCRRGVENIILTLCCAGPKQTSRAPSAVSSTLMKSTRSAARLRTSRHPRELLGREVVQAALRRSWKAHRVQGTPQGGRKPQHRNYAGRTPNLSSAAAFTGSRRFICGEQAR